MDSKVAIRALSEASDCLAAIEVQAWLTDGTLLGFYREGDFIAHDCDIDLGVHIDNWSESIIPTMQDCGFEFEGQRGTKENGLEYTFIKYDIAIDLFFFYGEGDEVWHSCWTKRLQLKYRYPRFDLKQVEFLGHPFLAPKNEEEFLAIKYGADWRTPTTKWHWAFSPENVELSDKSLSQRIAYANEKRRWRIRRFKKWYRGLLKRQ